MIRIKARAFVKNEGSILLDGLCVGSFSNSATDNREDIKKAIVYAVMYVLDDAWKFYEYPTSQLKVEITFTNDV